MYVIWGGDDTIVGTNTETKVRKLQSNVKSNTDVEALKIWNINQLSASF